MRAGIGVVATDPVFRVFCGQREPQFFQKVVMGIRV
jgi:hypothetical protein